MRNEGFIIAYLPTWYTLSIRDEVSCPPYVFHYLHENQVVLPKYDLFLPEYDYLTNSGGGGGGG